MSELSDDLVRRGFWIDWTYGPILGATITTDVASADVLIAFLAILVALATGSLWNLTLFALHQYRASKTNGDALFQQEQAILRSLPSPTLLFTDMAKLICAWSIAKTQRSKRRALLLMALSTVFGLAAIVASVLSSRIIQLSNVNVQVQKLACISGIDRARYDLAGPWSAPLYRAGATYADDCYSKDEAISGCNAYVQPRIPFTQTNVSCPLNDKSLCIASDPSAVVFDSGLLDLNEYFGVNDKPENRVFIRRQTTYFPVKVQGYYTVLNSSVAAPYINTWRPALPTAYDELFSFNYGQAASPDLIPSDQATVYRSTLASNGSFEYTIVVEVGYHEPSTIFSPLQVKPEFNFTDADIAFFVISTNAVTSMSPIEDAVFSAHRARYCDEKWTQCSDTPGPELKQTVYFADYPGGVVIGLQRVQVCLADRSGKASECTDLGATWLGRHPVLWPKANKAQQASLNLLTDLIWFTDVGVITESSASIKASKGIDVAGGGLIGLPRDQWVTEAMGWESTVWATLQHAFATRTIPFGAGSEVFVYGEDEFAQRLCDLQKVRRSGGFANINVFGLSFVVAMAAVTIFIDVVFLKIVIFLDRFQRLFGIRGKRWVQDGVLQLQRRAYEAEGFISWERVHEDVPIFTGQTKLPTLNQASSASLATSTSTLLPKDTRSETTYASEIQTDKAMYRPWMHVFGSERNSRGSTLKEPSVTTRTSSLNTTTRSHKSRDPYSYWEIDNTKSNENLTELTDEACTTKTSAAADNSEHTRDPREFWNLDETNRDYDMFAFDFQRQGQQNT